MTVIFECEPKMLYEGSYTDGIFSGSLYPTLSRSLIGSNVSGVYDGYIRSLTDYGQYSNFHLNSGSQVNIRNGTPNFVPSFQKNVTYFDSLMPNFDEVMQLDAYGLVLTNVPNPSGWPATRFIYPISTYHGGTRRRIHELHSPSGSISSDYWAITPPFSRRYKDIRRVSKVTSNVASLQYRASCSFGTAFGPGSPTPRPIAGVTQSWSSAASMSYDPNDTSFWGTAFGGFIQQVGSYSPAFVIASGSTIYNPTNQAKNSATDYSTTTHILVSITGSVDANYHFTTPGGGLDIPPTTWSLPNSANPKPTSPDDSDVVKAIYGFGPGPSNTPWFSNTNGSSWVIVAPLGFYLRYGTVIHGWKYGILNGFPESPKAIFRRNRYGHLFDLVQGRKFTKTIDSQGNIELPVEVIFVSGSQASLTASNPSLNPYDSGIYDTEYRSGQWFTDA